jgi:histidine triad (HIT) family protein
MAEDCIFCQIVEKKSPATIVFEDDNFLAFKNIYPVAETHILIIPKKHSKTLNDINDETLVNLFNTTKKIAKKLKLSGYKILINVEKPYQVIFHTHLHLIAGKVDKIKLASA